MDEGSYSGIRLGNLTNKTSPAFKLIDIDKDITSLTITVKNETNNIVETIIATRAVGIEKDPAPGEWTIVVDGVKNNQVKLTPQGTDWLLTLNKELVHGKYELNIETEDRAGNKSSDLPQTKKPQPLTLTIDTEAPDAPVISLESDTGVAGDNITKETRPTFKLELKDLAEDVIKLIITVTDQKEGKNTTIGPFTATKNSQGEWSLQPKGGSLTEDGRLKLSSDSWQDGDYRLSVIAEDQAGNQSKKPEKLNFDIDTALTQPRITLDAKSDSGDSNSDKLTNKTAPIFNLTDIDLDTTTLIITVKKEGSIVETVTAKRKVTGEQNKPKPGEWDITVTGEEGNQLDRQLASLTGKDRDWKLILSQQLTHGEYQLTIESEDRAGNKSSDEDRNKPDPLTIQIDTELSTPTISLDSGSDSGEKDNDNITNKTSPAFKLIDIDKDITSLTITVKNETNNIVETIIATRAVGTDKEPNPEGWTIVVDGVKNNQVKLTPQGTDWLLTLNKELVHGKYELNIETEDRAGNKSSDLPQTKKPQPLTLTIDTEVPDAPVISLESDSGVVGDNITKETQPVFKLELKDLAQDVIKLIIVVTDKEGNSVTYDDGKNTEIGSFTATKDNQGKWRLEPGDGSLTEDGRLKLSSASWKDGDYLISVIAEDQAGNQSTAPEKLNFDIDTVLTLPRITLDAESDSGDSNSDKLINKTAPIFNLTDIDFDTTTLIITVKKEGSIVETITAKRKVTGSHKEPKPDAWDIRVTGEDGKPLDTLLASLTEKGTDWQLTLSQQLTHGEYQLTIESEDRAGNKSSDLNTEAPSSLNLTIDTVKPPAPPMFLVEDHERGELEDHLTNVSTPTFMLDLSDLAEDVTKITIKVTDKADKEVQYPNSDKNIGTFTVTRDAAGGWTLTPSGGSLFEDGKLSLSSNKWKDGDYKLVVNAHDKAGNTSEKPTLFEFNLDTQITLPGILLDTASDTGDNTSYNITRITTPTFNLTGIDKDLVNISIKVTNVKEEIVSTLTATRKVTKSGATEWSVQPSGAVLKNTDGNWQIILKNELPDGEYNVNIVTADRAGNKKTSCLISLLHFRSCYRK
ncbi:Ig-like domain-containing protein [Candidatus Regiella insecticola]|uniref:Ig-like domain-containing protein n=1 Tax=Candidatus Regiella insecticola TaxID=138073 RepID=UPI001596C999|nr:Ig-like domain-containing protein [Candidatus Regiella insecticola]